MRDRDQYNIYLLYIQSSPPWIRVARSLVFCVDRCLYFYPLCSLSFNLRLLIAPLVSSNFSYINDIDHIIHSDDSFVVQIDLPS